MTPLLGLLSLVFTFGKQHRRIGPDLTRGKALWLVPQALISFFAVRADQEPGKSERHAQHTAHNPRMFALISLSYVWWCKSKVCNLILVRRCCTIIALQACARAITESGAMYVKLCCVSEFLSVCVVQPYRLPACLHACVRAYGPCAQVCVRTLNSCSKMIESSRQMALAIWIWRYRGEVNGISTVSMLLNSPRAYSMAKPDDSGLSITRQRLSRTPT